MDAPPSVTIVFLVHNRCSELRTSLEQMQASDYPPERVDVIVVDNASTDGSAEMVAQEFPAVRLIVRAENVGVSGWNEGFALARGDYVLALDDDCFLPTDGLRRAVAAAEGQDADLVSFKVVSTQDPDHVFNEKYLTGLFMFWGCAVLMRRRVVEALGGYDPEIFFLANELEFMLRFFDHGFRHLHLPEVSAQHMKVPRKPGDKLGFEEANHRRNSRHWGYILGKQFDPRQALEALVALLVRIVIDGLRGDSAAFKGAPDVFAGLWHGVRHRAPLRNPELARFYRQNFETFASPWWLLRPIPQLVRELPREILTQGWRLPDTDDRPTGRREAYLDARRLFYPDQATVLEFSPGPVAWPVS